MKCILTTLLLLLSGLGPWAQEGTRGSARTAAVVHALHGDADGLRERLERLDPRPVELLLELGLSGRIPDDWSTERAGPLSPQERTTLLEVLRGTGFRLLQPPLGELARESRSWPERMAGMLLLTEARQPEAVHLLLALAKHPEGQAAPSAVRAAYGDVLRRLVENDPKNLQALRPVLTSVPAGLITTTFAALETAPPGLLLELVAVNLGRVGGLDELFLAYSARYAVAGRRPFDPEVCGRIRPFLDHGDPRLQTAAANVLGLLGDHDSVSGLVDLLASGDANVVRSAHQALRRITGLGLAQRTELWERWLDAEQEWWQQSASAELERIRGRDPVAAAAGLRALSNHVLHRAEVAAELGAMLLDLGEQRALLVCGVLRHLGAPEALPWVDQAARSHPSATVQQRAGALREALLALSGPVAAVEARR